MTFNRTEAGSGYSQEPGDGRISNGKIYIGIVKNNQDKLKMGRLEVWIPEMGGEEDDPGKWHIVNYASPFAGATNVDDNVQDGQTMESSQRSYGWWSVPPDLNNEVLCCFASGEKSKGFWFACLWQQNMNHMVPGLASDASYQPGEQGILPPVVEYNKAQSDSSFPYQKPTRPRFDPLHNGLSAQGLYSDFERGPSSASARRDVPSGVVGLLTPRANQLYVDDNPDNEYIRLRTRGGTQILVHETNGYVYINSGSGNSWIEVSDLGIDIYSQGSISMRTEQDFNVQADRDINFNAGRNINIWNGGDFKARSEKTLQLNSGDDTRITSAKAMNLNTLDGSLVLDATGKLSFKATDNIEAKSEATINVTADSAMNLKSTDAMALAGSDINITGTGNLTGVAESVSIASTTGGGGLTATSGGVAMSGSNVNMSADGVMNMSAESHSTQATTIARDGAIVDNGGQSVPAQSADTSTPDTPADAAPVANTNATAPTMATQTDADSSTIDTTVSRMPTHEPWPGHPKSKSQTIPSGDGVGNGSTASAMGQGGGTLTTGSSTKSQVTGDGSAKVVPYDASKAAGHVTAGNSKISADVYAAIKKASSTIGVDYGYMMAMAQKESSFNPNAKAPTSSAGGLYQFIDSTWSQMIGKYGAQYGYTIDQKFDPEANAMMGALFARDNGAYLTRVAGISPGPNDLYMAHFLGAGSAAAVLSNANSPAQQVLNALDTRHGNAGDKAASANPTIFYQGGSPATGQQIADAFAKQIVPNTNYYNANPVTTT